MRLVTDAIGWAFLLIIAFLLLLHPFTAVLRWVLETLNSVGNS